MPHIYRLMILFYTFRPKFTWTKENFMYNSIILLSKELSFFLFRTGKSLIFQVVGKNTFAILFFCMYN